MGTTGLWAALWLPPGAPAGAQAPTISITDFAFTPAASTAQMVPPEPTFLQPHAHAGFSNNGETQHNVTFDNPAATSSPNMNPGAFFDAVFTAAGDFRYRCTIHPSMTGTITVLPLPTPPTAATEPPTTAAPSTVAPTTQAPAAPTTRPRTAATTRAGPVTTAVPTTLATTVAPPAGEPATVPTTPPPTSTTTTTTGGVALPAQNTSSDSPRWSVIVLVVVLAAGGAAFGARTVLQRRRPPGAPPGDT